MPFLTMNPCPKIVHHRALSFACSLYTLPPLVKQVEDCYTKLAMLKKKCHSYLALNGGLQNYISVHLHVCIVVTVREYGFNNESICTFPE